MGAKKKKKFKMSQIVKKYLEKVNVKLKLT
jgi:hypothetical protein